MESMKASSKNNSTRPSSSILRRLLCCRSLPTHPSDDQFADGVDNNHHEKCLDSSSFKPGVVARLMGLEPLTYLPVKQKSCSSYSFRSKSANSIDFLSHGFDINEAATGSAQFCHRRAKTCVTFTGEHLGEDDKFRVVFPLEEGVNGEEKITVIIEKSRQEKKTGPKKSLMASDNVKRSSHVSDKRTSKHQKNSRRQTGRRFKERKPATGSRDSKKVEEEEEVVEKQLLSESNPAAFHIFRHFVEFQRVVDGVEEAHTPAVQNYATKNLILDEEDESKKDNYKEICHELGQQILQDFLCQIVCDLVQCNTYKLKMA